MLLSGRFNILCLIIISLIILFYNKDFIIKNFFKVLIYIFTILIIVHGTELYKKKIKSQFERLYSQEEIKKFETNSLNLNILRNSVPQSNSNIIYSYFDEKFGENFAYYNLMIKLNNLSTGRLMKWIFIIDKNEKYFLGQGPNMDRKFFKTEILKMDKNKANDLVGADDFSLRNSIYLYIIRYTWNYFNYNFFLF